MRKAAVFPEPDIRQYQSHPQSRLCYSLLTRLSNCNQVMASQDGGNGVCLNRGRYIVAAQTDVFPHDRVYSCIVKLGDL